MNKDNRDSNMELLRIVSMVFVVILHENQVLGGGGFIGNILESLAIVAVNAFVLLSGWYGIKLSLKKMFALLFQVFFFSGLFLVIQLITGTHQSIFRELLDIVTLRQYWFVGAYILLMILAPALNAFAGNADKKSFLLVLILFYVIQTVLSYINNSPWYQDGFSPLPFAGLYLLARYMRIHVPRHPRQAVSLLCYLFISVFMAGTSLFLMTRYGTQGRMFNYTNPLLVASSVFFFLCFVPHRYYRSSINWISSSVFAVYLLQMNPYFLDNHFKRIVSGWIGDSMYVVFAKAALLIIVLGVLAILFDKIRILLWNKVFMLFPHKTHS